MDKYKRNFWIIDKPAKTLKTPLKSIHPKYFYFVFTTNI